MSRVPMGSDGGAWAMDPETNYDTSFVPAGHRRRPDRDDRGLHPRGRRRLRRRARRSAPPRRGRAATSPSSVVPVKDLNGLSSSTTTSTCAPARPSRRLGKLKPSFAAIGEMGGFDAVALQKYHWVEKINHVHHARQLARASSTAPRWCSIGSEQTGERAGPDARARGSSRPPLSGADPTIMLTGPAPATPQGARQGRPDRRRHRPVRDQRGVRRGRAAVP